jgi:hypothetical protein
MENADAQHLEKALRGLTRAMWAIAIAIIALVVMSALPLIAPDFYFRTVSDAATTALESHRPEPPGDGPPVSTQFEYPDFHKLPIEEKVKAASVIAIGRYEQGDGSKLRAIITEILKKTPGTAFYYEMGQEVPSASLAIRPNTNYGDGALMFFAGSPAMMRESLAVSNGRISALGDMPLDQIREMVLSVSGDTLPNSRPK